MKRQPIRALFEEIQGEGGATARPNHQSKAVHLSKTLKLWPKELEQLLLIATEGQKQQLLAILERLAPPLSHVQPATPAEMTSVWSLDLEEALRYCS
jgi:hypothetical protein